MTRPTPHSSNRPSQDESPLFKNLNCQLQRAEQTQTHRVLVLLTRSHELSLTLIYVGRFNFTHTPDLCLAQQ